MSPAVRRHPLVRAIAGSAVLALAVVLVTGCRPEPEPTSTPSDEATPSATVETPSPTPRPTPTPLETNLPDAGFALPKRCEEIYSAEMLASLQAANPPLNDPGVTMNASQNVDALELLTSGIPTIRCSWGQPSESGLATNVSVIDARQSASLLVALRADGFGCQPMWDGTLCEIAQRTVNLDDEEVEFGETHFVRDDGWVSTAWVDFAPAGYTADIVTTLWG